mgnify:CR=1 FL=1
MAIPNRQGTRACHSHLSPWESYNLKSCFVFSYEVELLWYMDIWEGYYGRPILWQSLIGRGPWHAIPIFLLENHMVGLIRFVTVHDSAMQSRLPFSSVLPHFCTRKLLRIKKSAILLLGIQSTTPSSNFGSLYQLYYILCTVESPQFSELIRKSIIELILFWEWTFWVYQTKALETCTYNLINRQSGWFDFLWCKQRSSKPHSSFLWIWAPTWCSRFCK